jgi:putative restriction endonuclease
MNYWWVNHKQTFRQEFSGGYVWCPKRKSDDSINHFYETMRRVKRGDIVFSFANGAVQGSGFAQTYCYSCPKPDDFGKVGDAWDKSGWRVDVDFRKFPKPLKTAQHSDLIGPLLPEKYSPIRKNGYGNQGAYFSGVSVDLGLLVLSLAAPLLHQAMTRSLAYDPAFLIDDGHPVITEWENRQQHDLENNDNLEPTTRTALVQSRRGQGKFRKLVADREHACRITAVQNPAHLIASHIKPWRESDNQERLSAGNGLMLTPSIDHLFDRGFISFEDSGDLIISPVADIESLEKMGIQPGNRTFGQAFNGDQKHFMGFHRNEILLRPVA